VETGRFSRIGAGESTDFRQKLPKSCELVNLASEPTYQTKQPVTLISQKLIKNKQAINRSSVFELTATLIRNQKNLKHKATPNDTLTRLHVRDRSFVVGWHQSRCGHLQPLACGCKDRLGGLSQRDGAAIEHVDDVRHAWPELRVVLDAE
jgi:hypothetical protein